MEYQVSALITISTFTTIKADSEEEALEKASMRIDLMSIASNNGDSEYTSWMVEDLDGTPFDLKID